MKKPDNPKDSFLTAFGIYGAVGFQLVITVVLGLYAGKWLDSKFHTDPWLLMVGIFLGTTAGFYNLYQIISRNADRNDENNK